MQFRVQFGINLHERVFQKAEIARAAPAAFLKPFFSHSRKLFSKFLPNIFVIISRNIIGLENFLLPFSQA